MAYNGWEIPQLTSKDFHGKKTTLFDSKKITLSGLETLAVTPIVKGPSGRKFSFSTNSPCYFKFTFKNFKDKHLKKGWGGKKMGKDLEFNIS